MPSEGETLQKNDLYLIVEEFLRRPFADEGVTVLITKIPGRSMSCVLRTMCTPEELVPFRILSSSASVTDLHGQLLLPSNASLTAVADVLEKSTALRGSISGGLGLRSDEFQFMLHSGTVRGEFHWWLDLDVFYIDTPLEHIVALAQLGMRLAQIGGAEEVVLTTIGYPYEKPVEPFSRVVWRSV